MVQSISDCDSKQEFETVLNNEIGQFGKFQIVNIFLLAFPAIFSGFMAGDYVFTAGVLPHRCSIPECDGVTPEYSPEWILNAIPATSSGFDNCRRYANVTSAVVLPGETCPAEWFLRNITVPCESYVYERTNTVVYDFNLECQEWLRVLSGMLNSLGAMVALVVAGYVSDTFGRRVSIMFFAFNVAAVGIIKSFSVNYGMYVTLQFAHVATGGGLFSAAYILAAEIVGPKYRVATSATMSSMFGLGQVFLGLIASAVHEWRQLTLTLFIPVFILLSYYWIVCESHRWLISKNKKKEAKKALLKAAAMNGKTFSDSSMNFLLNALSKENVESKSAYKKEISLYRQVLQSPVMLRRCMITPIMWVATTFIYYGLSINSVGLSGNMYINYMATAAAEIPGFILAVLILDRVGRKITLFTGYTLCGVCCLTFAFTAHKASYGVSLFLYLFGKFFIGLVFTSLYLFTAELYPTRHRHSFLGFSSMIGRIGSVIAPLTPPLMDYWSGIPSVLFGAMAIIAGLLVLTQPETLGLKVPDTFEDAEQLGKIVSRPNETDSIST